MFLVLNSIFDGGNYMVVGLLGLAHCGKHLVVIKKRVQHRCVNLCNISSKNYMLEYKINKCNKIHGRMLNDRDTPEHGLVP